MSIREANMCDGHQRVILLSGGYGGGGWSARLQDAGIVVHRVSTAGELLGWIAEERFAAALVDIDAAGSGLELSDSIRGLQPTLQVLWLAPKTVSNSLRDALLEVGFAWIDDSWSTAQLLRTIRLAGEQQWLLAENQRLAKRLAFRRGRDLVGHSTALSELRQAISIAAAGDQPVVIMGEAGTGKDLVARALHEASDRAYRPLIRLDCNAYNSVSLERELFGSASLRLHGEEEQPPQPGRLALANGGTLLLDQITELPLAIQARLARVLEARSFQPHGAPKPIPLDVRCLVTTRHDLRDAVAQGTFRNELLKHLTGQSIHVPPLRMHLEDIAQLTEHFLQQIATREGMPARRLTVETLVTLEAHVWPGNVRELENLIYRVCQLDQEARLTPEMLVPWLESQSDSLTTLPMTGLTLRDMERKLIESTFLRFGGNRERTAQSLQIGIRTLSGKLREYGYPPRGGPGSNQNPQKRRAA